MHILASTIAFVLLASMMNVTPVRQAEKPAAKEQRSAPAQERQPRSSGTIRGRVLGEGGRAVPEASILSLPVNVTSNLKGAIGSLLKPVNSDAEGKFELSGLPAGAYTLSAGSPGYVLSDSDLKSFYRPGDNVTLNLVKGGVITGKVTNSSGDPVVGAAVRAVKIRDLDNKPARTRRDAFSEFTDSNSLMLGTLGPYKTDDRGIYRIYGLSPGYYQVAAGGRAASLGVGATGPYDGDAPTYFPSGTIDTAAEVLVRSGEEALNIDIRYREHRGHSISGTVSAPKRSGQESISVTLYRAGNAVVEGTDYVFPGTEKGFAFNALLDGDYLVTAMASSGAMVGALGGLSLSLSPARRVTVNGADVTGVELSLEPLASMSGRLVVQPLPERLKAECKTNSARRIEEVVIGTRRDLKQKSDEPSVALLSAFMNTTANEQGEFKLSFVRPGVNRLSVELPGENLYIKSITLPPPVADGKPIDAARSGVKVTSGDQIKGLIATLAEGAAALSGKLVTGEDKKAPAAKMQVYLVPSEPEAADDVLRYFEGEVGSDGSFSFTNLSPGKYWMVAREAAEQGPADADPSPLAWQSSARLSLRFEGEASKKVIELSECQRTADVVLTYVPLIKPNKLPTRKAEH